MDNEGLVEDVNEEEIVTQFSDSVSGNSYFNFTSSIIGLIESNGWFILIGCVLIYYIYNKYKNRLSFDSINSRSFHREVDEEKELRRLQKIEEARMRQQAALDAAAAKYLEEKKLKEEEKAKEKIKEWELHQQGLGYHGKSKKNDSDDLAALGLSQRTKLTPKSKLKGDDYNPLTGQSSNNTDNGGGSCSYRPSRKSNNKGG